MVPCHSEPVQSSRTLRDNSSEKVLYESNIYCNYCIRSHFKTLLKVLHVYLHKKRYLGDSSGSRSTGTANNTINTIRK